MSDDRIFKKTDDVRLVMGILIGMACSSDARRNEIKTLTPFRDNLPRDLVMLLEAVEAKDGEKVFRWFENKDVHLARGEGVKLPMALAGHLLRFHWWTEANKVLGRMSEIKELPIGELMYRMKEAVKMLEDAKVQPTEPKPLEYKHETEDHRPA